MHKSFALAVFGLLVLAVGHASAATRYDYLGNNFDTVEGTAPQVTTSDHLSGYVVFSSEPLPGPNTAADVIDFSMTDGARTLSSANGDDLLVSTNFLFDASLNMSDWQFFSVPDGELTQDNEISSDSGRRRDISRLDNGLTQNARAAEGGWTAVPEPASGMMLLAALGALLGRRARNG